MKLTACLIVKNEAEMLERTLPGLSRSADEIILVDTGSTDNTVEVAKKYGAQVHHFAWIKDFAAARNESLRHAGGDWIIWIDADEYLDEENLQLIKQQILTSRANAITVT